MKNEFLIAFALIAALVALPAVAAADTVADGTTTLKVKLALLTKLGADSLKINVDSLDGAVSLDGMVAKRETAELAKTVAAGVEGVAKVDSHLSVETPPAEGAVTRAVGEAEAEVKDGILESKVRLALVDKLGSDGFRIGTEAASGVVTLEFGAEIPDERRSMAVKAVEGIEGVTKVLSLDKH
ncbi:MAG: BON domain-containing protein [Thermoanaerobaculia bacterium]|nr:MAG: BON domain-containing protein [Thermoanaerobaculia bacterium]MBZ0101052.1 BON domain-containing protein [Thermoanaerobaculia bacterium]